MKKKVTVLIPFIAYFLCLSYGIYGQGSNCLGEEVMMLGHGSEGEGIAFNPVNGLLYHVSGISDTEEFFETVNPSTMIIGPNLAGGTYGPDAASEITAIVWYPPLNAFIAIDLDENIFSVNPTTGAFTMHATLESGANTRGLAVVGAPGMERVYGVETLSSELIEFDPMTGVENFSVSITRGGLPVSRANGLATHPNTGDVYIIYTPNGGGSVPRRLGIIDLDTGEVTDLGNMGLRFAGITFDSDGGLFAITGDGATPSETLFSNFPCIIQPQPIPVLPQWGIIILGLVLLLFGVTAYTKSSISASKYVVK